MKLVAISPIILLCSITACFAQESLDTSKYSVEQIDIIKEFSANLQTIASRNIGYAEHEELVNQTLLLFNKEALLNIKSNVFSSIQKFKVLTYLYKARMLAIESEIIDISFNNRNKITSATLLENKSIKQ